MVADRALDMALFLHGEAVGASGNGWCEGGYCCQGTNLDARDAEYRAIAAEAAQDEADRLAAEQERADCAAGICDHYTCTQGWALVEWEYNERHGF